ncbi:MAG: hypothetical protein RLY16_756 [Bacteroidota bacterium]
MKFITTIALFCLTGIAAAAQNTDSIVIRKLADDILTHNNAYENLRYLCKKVGARLSGSKGAQKAVIATAKMLKEAGADTVYLQPCMVPHWVRGTQKEIAFITGANGKKRNLKICALGNSVGTGPKGITGRVIEVRSFAELDALGTQSVKGNIVFFNFAMNPKYIQTFNAYGESGIARRSGPSRAAKLGAIGVIVRSLASNLDDHPHTGVTSYNDSFPKIPAVAISTNDAELLSKTLMLKMEHRIYLQTNCKLEADAPSFNVVGEIRGSKFPEEIITVGGHLDSWDLAEGAHDDGTGCMQSIEIIRAFKSTGIQPQRTIRAVMFMNEENGGRGAKAYFEAAKKANEKHIFALESDAGGFTPRGFGVTCNEKQLAQLQSYTNLLKPYGVYQITAGGGGADIGPLKELGTVLAGLSPDSQRYFDLHHAETDVFEAVSKRELELGAINMAALIYLVDRNGL